MSAICPMYKHLTAKTVEPDAVRTLYTPEFSLCCRKRPTKRPRSGAEGCLTFTLLISLYRHEVTQPHARGQHGSYSSAPSSSSVTCYLEKEMSLYLEITQSRCGM